VHEEPEERAEGEEAYIAPLPSAPPLVVVNVNAPVFDLRSLNPFSGTTKVIVLALLLLLLAGNVQSAGDDEGVAALLAKMSSQLDAIQSENALQKERIGALERDIADRDGSDDDPLGDPCEALSRASKDAKRCIDLHNCEKDVFNAINHLRGECKKRKKPTACESRTTLDVHLKSCIAANSDCSKLMNEWLELDDVCDSEHEDRDINADCDVLQDAYETCVLRHPVAANQSEATNTKHREKCLDKYEEYRNCMVPNSRQSKSARAMYRCVEIMDTIDRFNCEEAAMALGVSSYFDQGIDKLDGWSASTGDFLRSAGAKTKDTLKRGREIVLRTGERVEQFIKPLVGRNGNSGSARRYYS
jgi:hypothetical protein